MKKILLMSNDTLLCKLFMSGTKDFTLHTAIVQDLQKAIEIIRDGQCDTVVINTPLLSERCPKKIILQIQEISPYIPIFVLMDQMEVSQAISLTKHGAEYCYSKPFALDQIIENIDHTLKSISPSPPLNRSNREAVRESHTVRSKYVNAKSKAAEYLYSQIDKVADTNFKVIIYGETGTGKEAVARRLCEGKKYKDKPFVAVDCGCLSKELAASELFGHKKGSFSGAIEDKKGAFEEANGGTIFLDEIGNLDYSVQILLLRAIEENKIKKIGCNEEIDINVRIIVASNEKLSTAVENGEFREDLYYRLNEFEIMIPPLRDRIDDLELFIDFFINDANTDLGKNILGVESDLLEKFKSYDWPGNIRELKNTIRRGCLMASNMITATCMSPEFLNKLQNKIKGLAYDDAVLIPNAITKDDLKLKSIIAEYEEILKVLKEENYNKTKTAQRLNINRKTLYNKLRTFNNISSQYR